MSGQAVEPHMVVPKVDVLTHDGVRVPLASLFAARPLALVLLRHLGCIFCREQVADLRDHPDLNVVFVSMASPTEASKFRQEMRSPHLFLCDPARELYQAFGLARGTVGQLFNYRTLSRGLRATLAGHRQTRPTADPFQLPGMFIIVPGGEIVWEKRGENAADHANAETIQAQLEAAQGRLSTAG